MSCMVQYSAIVHVQLYAFVYDAHVCLLRLWEEGWKERYYINKFGVPSGDVEFRSRVVEAHTQGLCWVFAYYYQVCVHACVCVCVCIYVCVMCGVCVHACVHVCTHMYVC